MRDNVSRAGRKAGIKSALIIQALNGNDRPFTMRKIAKFVQMKPSTHLLKILDEMTREGMLLQYWESDRPGRWDTKMYALKDMKPVKNTRSISIKKQGKEIGQMELFS
jgi:hypothetical protein